MKKHIMEGKGKHHFFTFFQFNHVIQTLIVSEVVVLGAFGLSAPIFAVFVGELVPGADIKTAAIAATVYLFTRSLGQIPIGMIIDKTKGERDDLIAMLAGTFLAGFVPLFYMFVETAFQLYMVQFFYGLASAIVFPAWMAIFTRHIDSRHEGMEWGAYRSLVDLSTAIAAIAGGFIASRFGFNAVFALVSIVTFAAGFHLLCLRSIVVKTHHHGGKKNKQIT